MTAYEQAVVQAWLKTNRGERTQEDLAAAIRAATGWNIQRDRYSRYESGALPMGTKVLGHFVEYWKSQDRDGPDFTPPKPQPSIEERTLKAAEDQTEAIKALVGELRQWRTEDRDRLAQVEAVVDRLVGPVLDGPDTSGSTTPAAPQGKVG